MPRILHIVTCKLAELAEKENAPKGRSDIMLYIVTLVLRAQAELADFATGAVK